MRCKDILLPVLLCGSLSAWAQGNTPGCVFSYKWHEEKPELIWQLNSKVENEFFYIESSIDSIHFYNTGHRIEAAGSMGFSAFMPNYSGVTTYYKLYRKASDGNVTFMGMLKVPGIKYQIGEEELAPLAYPNPSAGAFYLQYLPDNYSGVQLLSAEGNILEEKPAGEANNWNLEAYVPGVYFLRIVTIETGVKLVRVLKY